MFNKPVLTAPQQIVQAIKDAILDGRLRQGDRLPTEEEMAEMFGVSRPTVREALRTLRAANVLVLERGRTGGYRIGEFSLTALGLSVSEFLSLSLSVRTLSYAQLYEVRQPIEMFAAYLGAQRRTDEDIARLHAALPDPDQFANVDDLLDADLVFHRVLAECTHNPLAVAFAAAMAQAFHFNHPDLSDQGLAKIVEHLDEIIDAVERRDSQAASQAMRQHLANFAQHFGVDHDELGLPSHWEGQRRQRTGA